MSLQECWRCRPYTVFRLLLPFGGSKSRKMPRWIRQVCDEGCRGNSRVMSLMDITGFAKRIEEGQGELNDRLDRIIELLEVLCAMLPSSMSSNAVPFRRPHSVSGNGHPLKPA